jgi:hypothetical protein
MAGMKFLQACAGVSFLAATRISPVAQGTTNSLTGQWDFNEGDLRATVGQDLQFLGDTATKTTFDAAVVNGANAKVMHFPAADPTEGYLMLHGAQPNGGGTNVNVYTIVMDLLWPGSSDGTFRALYNSDPSNQQDAVMFVNPDGAIGINNDYSGEMLPDTWYRLAIVVDLPNGKITKYLNGVTDTNQVQRFTDNVVDSRFSLGPSALLFTSGSGETAEGLVDRIQFYSDALTADQVAALGIPLGDGGPATTGDVTITGIQKVGDNVVITAAGGGNLQLQQKATLQAGTTWQAIGQPTASGTFTVPANGATGFFRVQRL